jgi:hypothetical protein
MTTVKIFKTSSKENSFDLGLRLNSKKLNYILYLYWALFE